MRTIWGLPLLTVFVGATQVECFACGGRATFMNQHAATTTRRVSLGGSFRHFELGSSTDTGIGLVARIEAVQGTEPAARVAELAHAHGKFIDRHQALKRNAGRTRMKFLQLNALVFRV